MGRDGEMARMARIFGLYWLVVVVCVHTVKYYFFDDVFMSCNSGFTCLRCYGIPSTTVTSDTVTGVHMQQACS